MNSNLSTQQAHRDQRLVSAYVSEKSFPCVGAKSALNRDRMRFARFGALGDPEQTAKIIQHLNNFSIEFPNPGVAPVSFVAMFDDTGMDEKIFEQALWAQLQAVHELDFANGNNWNSSVQSDPTSSEFSFSVRGRAFFVVGIHPKASRLARRAPTPCLVFNFHDQFEALKASGKYQPMQKSIRARDVALQGSENPVLSRFGESSEARQYSGRNVGAAWKCPFHVAESQI